MDRFSKTCLALIVVLLSVIALRPILNSQPAEAAHRYKYEFSCGGCSVQERSPDVTLNRYASQGWEFVGAVAGQSPGQPFLVFRK